MASYTCSGLQYIRNGWYFKVFCNRPDHHVAMACSAGFPDTLDDWLNHHSWFESGETALGACEKLERKMGFSSIVLVAPGPTK